MAIKFSGKRGARFLAELHEDLKNENEQYIKTVVIPKQIVKNYQQILQTEENNRFKEILNQKQYKQNPVFDNSPQNSQAEHVNKFILSGINPKYRPRSLSPYLNRKIEKMNDKFKENTTLLNLSLQKRSLQKQYNNTLQTDTNYYQTKGDFVQESVNQSKYLMVGENTIKVSDENAWERSQISNQIKKTQNEVIAEESKRKNQYNEAIDRVDSEDQPSNICINVGSPSEAPRQFKLMTGLKTIRVPLKFKDRSSSLQRIGEDNLNSKAMSELILNRQKLDKLVERNANKQQQWKKMENNKEKQLQQKYSDLQTKPGKFEDGMNQQLLSDMNENVEEYHKSKQRSKQNYTEHMYRVYGPYFKNHRTPDNKNYKGCEIFQNYYQLSRKINLPQQDQEQGEVIPKSKEMKKFEYQEAQIKLVQQKAYMQANSARNKDRKQI